MLLTYVAMVAAVICYLAAAGLIAKRLTDPDAPLSKTKALSLGLIGTLIHAALLQDAMHTPHGLNFGFTVVSSLATWFVTGLLLLTSFRKPTENLGIVVLPLAAISILLQVVVPTEHLLATHETQGLGVHILFSILAYSLLGLATVQAMLLSIQERHLHNRSPGGFIRALPPMETMESLLFQMIIIGFVLQSMSLASGVVYLDNMFAQHLVHKTVLSVLAWLVFAALLWGHWQHGWRGRTAVRWTLSGFFTLVLAYFGSKYVLEILLER